LPTDFVIVIRLLDTSHASARGDFLARLAGTLRAESRTPLVLVSGDPDIDALHAVDPACKIAVAPTLLGLDGTLAERRPIDSVVALDDEILNKDALTPLGKTIARLHSSGRLPGGAALLCTSGVPSVELLATVSKYSFITAITTTSVMAVSNTPRTLRTMVDETFRGREVDTETWALGYARVGSMCHVYQDDGVHIDIQPFHEPATPPSGDDVERRLRLLEGDVALLRKRTATYHGGGLGLVQGVEGSFVAEVEVHAERAAQGTMFELAALNANPGRHQHPWNPDGSPNTPATDQEVHSFFDPHGAPPFVGSEHDEDDGFRINSHFGSEYTDNNYGSDAGDGRIVSVKLRLERRGPFFAAYFRPFYSEDPVDWVCSGVVRNDSLNARVFLRYAGKRWRKGTSPVVPNRFLISRVVVNLRTP
jgi:hypothetical protein